ncbi:unnamed protein product [Caenorhabditis auriculariae]|uniref:Uncharacterized protein n=1 Tax=Caenorhabditis auriculariae TaxID=2777116 RepID=A0A8S1GPV6_9PELO|nr:unnamed protein product [Caenorhabditis auriculariae]
MSYEFTIDDDELEEPTSEKGTMCDWYRIELPASASTLSRQIAKAQAKRAEREARRRRKDLSTVRERDDEHREEQKMSTSLSELTIPMEQRGRSRPEPRSPGALSNPEFTYASPTNSPPPDPFARGRDEPVDEEERELLELLFNGNQKAPWGKPAFPEPAGQTPVKSPQSPGLPSLATPVKVSEWLMRTPSVDAVSITSTSLNGDGPLSLMSDDEEEDEFFDASEVIENTPPRKKKEDAEVERITQGVSLCRLGNGNPMTQSLVRVEEETMADGGSRLPVADPARSARSSSVSPRPPANTEFNRNSPTYATFSVKSGTPRAQLTPSTNTQPQQQQANGNSMIRQPMTSTPLSRTTRSVLRVHNVNSAAGKTPNSLPKKPENGHVPQNGSSPAILEPAVSPIPPASMYSTPMRPTSASGAGSNRSTPSIPPEVLASRGLVKPNFERIQDLVQMQEEALRKAVLAQQEQDVDRKTSWQGELDPARQSASTHSSLGSLTSSKSVDGSALRLSAAAGGAPPAPASRIPAPSRSRLPTPRATAKRVSSVSAAAVRPAAPKPQPVGLANAVVTTADFSAPGDECF